MFERYSDQARAVVARATDEAAELGHGHLGTEHLLLGLLAQEGNIAARALPVGTTIPIVRRKVAEAVGTNGSAVLAGGPGRAPVEDDGGDAGTDDPPLTPRARRALERASRFSMQRRHPAVDPDHVLLGVLDVEGTAGQVLRGLGVDVGRLSDAVDRRSASAPVTTADGGPTSSPRALVPAHEPAVPGPSTPELPVPATVPAREFPSTSGPASGPGRASPAAADGATDHGGPATPGRPSPGCPSCGAAMELKLAYRVVSARNEAGQRRPFVVTYCGGCGATVGVSPA